MITGISPPQGLYVPPRTATLVVAASDSTQKCKVQADYVCDGVNDHVEIQAALDALPAGGGRVMLSEGTFNIEVSIELGAYQTLEGQGPSTILTTTTADLDIINTAGGFGTEINFITLHNFVVDGAAGGVVNDIGIYMKYCDHLLIEGVEARDCGEDGIRTTYCTHLKILENKTSGCTRGIFVDGCNYITAEANETYDNSQHGIHLYGCYYANITSNISHGNVLDGIVWSTGWEDIVNIVGNVAYDNTRYGISVEAFSSGTLAGNSAYYNGDSGFYVGAYYCTITGNASGYNGNHGFEFGGDESTLSDNLAGNNTNDGIHLTNSGWNTFTGNMLFLNGHNGIYVDKSMFADLTPIVISCNSIKENGYHGIHLINVINGVISNNLLEKNSLDIAATYHCIYLEGTCRRCSITDNQCVDDGTDQEDGIHLADGANECIIAGNYCYNLMGSGIALMANNDNCLIKNNLCNDNDDYGIEIVEATCDKNIVAGNELLDNVTGQLLDSGTLTHVEDDNRGIEITQIKHFRRVKNTSGAQRTAGHVVSLKAVAAGNEIDVPAAVGEDDVYGMIAETINNNDFGLVQVKGKTTALKATNAAGNIAIGDKLCTEATGVRAQLAGVGDQAFARALEACAAADCTIDAYIMSPWD